MQAKGLETIEWLYAWVETAARKASQNRPDHRLTKSTETVFDVASCFSWDLSSFVLIWVDLHIIMAEVALIGMRWSF